MSTKTVHIRYYALLKEKCGSDEETVTTSAASLKDLYAEISARYQLTFPIKLLKVALNDQFCEWKTPIKNNDRIVFIPPVAGG